MILYLSDVLFDNFCASSMIINDFLESNNWEFDNLINIDIIAYYDKFGNISMISKK